MDKTANFGWLHFFYFFLKAGNVNTKLANVNNKKIL